MKIYKRSDGRYFVKFKDDLGVWKQRSFANEEKALAYIKEIEPTEEESCLTVEEAVILYCKNHSLGGQTKSLYASLVCGYERRGRHVAGCAEHLAGRFVETLTRRDLESFRDAARDLGVTVNTVNKYCSMLKTCFRYAADQDFLESIPWSKYKPLEGEPHKSHKADKPEDVWKVVAKLPPWAQWACDTCISLCLRPGASELFNLKWDAFDWRAGCVAVWMGKVGRTKLIYPSPGYLARAKERHVASASEFVVEGPKGGRCSPSTFQTSWRSARMKVGATIPSYSMRHLAASTMLAQGVSIAVVAEMLGHKNPATTAQYYVHSSVEEQKRASAMLPDLHNFGANGVESEG